jgi:hypothetical protein
VVAYVGALAEREEVATLRSKAGSIDLVLLALRPKAFWRRVEVGSISYGES